MPNVELLERTLAYIEELALADEKGEPVTDTAGGELHWDQSDWTYLTFGGDDTGVTTGELCGTACCFAGWAVILEAEADTPQKVLTLFSQGPTVPGVVRQQNHMADGRSIEDAAKELLGLNYGEADELFAASNDLDDLRSIVRGLIDG